MDVRLWDFEVIHEFQHVLGHLSAILAGSCGFSLSPCPATVDGDHAVVFGKCFCDAVQKPIAVGRTGVAVHEDHRGTLPHFQVVDFHAIGCGKGAIGRFGRASGNQLGTQPCRQDCRMGRHASHRWVSSPARAAVLPLARDFYLGKRRKQAVWPGSGFHAGRNCELSQRGVESLLSTRQPRSLRRRQATWPR